MKNIHILPTSQPSRLVKVYNEVDIKNFTLKLDIEVNDNFKEYQNIYITSDEDLKDDEHCITFGSDICKGQLDTFCGGIKYSRKPLKIILTTDQDLIADGVQAIDDEFLEWFVNNSSCEEVEVADLWKEGTPSAHDSYQIIIPQEEPKQESHICKYCDAETTQPDDECYAKPKQEYQSECICENSCRGFVNVKCKQLKKQETLEEAAEEFYPPITTDLICSPKLVRDAFIAGANWQAERMYSDMQEYAEFCVECDRAGLKLIAVKD